MRAKNIVIVTIAAIAVVGGGYLISQNRAIAPTITNTSNNPTASPTASISNSSTPSVSVRVTPRNSSSPAASTSPSSQPSPSATPIATIISYTNSGFHPDSIKIKTGTTIVFKNDSTSSTWPASDDHPSHKNYPGSDSLKCGTPEAVSIFDACKPVQPGESWSFTFTAKGAWRYHDHLNPINKGLITVE